MTTIVEAKAEDRDRERHVRVMATPPLWVQWPFLPVVRRGRGQLECGLLCDLIRLEGGTGRPATVHLGNLFLMPPTLDEFVRLPKEVYDTPEEVYQAGWRID